ncbi:MAG: hypothetical protein KF795_00935 [Labilithrix sp.]|nr:hypothetical protein [Labilithrix sp.]
MAASSARTLGRLLFALPLLLGMGLTRQAHAEADSPQRSGRLDVLRSPEVTVRAGAVFPMFLIYENPGPLAGVTLGWRLAQRLELVARGEAGALFFDGIQRYQAKLGVGVRLMPWPKWPVSPWVQLGVGTTAHAERVGVVLPERTASATDFGAVVTADASLGVRIVQRFEVGLGWDHIVVPWSYYSVYMGNEADPHRGYALAWFGVKL